MGSSPVVVGRTKRDVRSKVNNSISPDSIHIIPRHHRSYFCLVFIKKSNMDRDGPKTSTRTERDIQK